MLIELNKVIYKLMCIDVLWNEIFCFFNNWKAVILVIVMLFNVKVFMIMCENLY